MRNFALVWPSGTVTVAGTLAAPKPAFRFTTTPPAGAGLNNVTLPLALSPDLMLAGAETVFTAPKS